MYTITIVDITKGTVLETKTDFLDVTAMIRLDDQDVSERKFGFAPSSTEDEIKAELQKVLDTFVSDQHLATESQRSEELEAHVSEVQANLQDVTLTLIPSDAT